MFKRDFQVFVERQLQEAEGQRAEMLSKDLTGTKLLLERVLVPVFGGLEGFVLEHESISLAGVRIYTDVFHPRLRIAFEEESYTAHAEKVSRGRFSFERMRIRSAAKLGYTYCPFSRDEIEDKPDFCRSNLYEIIGQIGSVEASGIMELPLYEREVIRCGLLRLEPFDLGDVSTWLMVSKETSRRVLRDMKSKGLIDPFGGSELRSYQFLISSKAVELMHRKRKFIDR